MQDTLLKQIPYFASLSNEIASFGKDSNWKVGGKESRQLTNEEYQRILPLIESPNFIFYPCRTFNHVYFALGRVIHKGEDSSCFFTCREDQLPDGHSFDTLISLLLEEDHFERAKKAGVDIVRNKEFYLSLSLSNNS